jgi:hypothetical protein
MSNIFAVGVDSVKWTTRVYRDVLVYYEEKINVDAYQKRIFAFSEIEPSGINIAGLQDLEVDDRDVLVDGND